MSQLVLEGIPTELLDRLDGYARQHGVSATEAAFELLARALPLSASAPVEVAGALVEVDGLLLHSGKLALGAGWPGVTEFREELADELLARSLASRV